MERATMRSKTACFTGHRELPQNKVKSIEVMTEATIQQLYDKSVRFFGVGGALGYDTLAADVLFRLRASYMSDIKIILVYPFDGFTDRWKPEQQARHKARLPFYDKVVCVSDKPSREAYLARDRHLVDGSTYCVAYQTKGVGGTAYTTRYAQEHGVEVYNIAKGI